MTGTSEELLQMLKVLLVLSHYSDRSFQPSASATIEELPFAATALTAYSEDNTTTVERAIYSIFPLPEISNAIDVDILASDYSIQAAKFLLGTSILTAEGNATLIEPSLRHSKLAKSLLQTVDLGSSYSLFSAYQY